MRPPGFFDLEERFAKLDGLGDPLVKIAQVVDWEGFRSVLNRAFAKSRKSNAGRKKYDRVLMFKILVLQQLYNLSDDRKLRSGYALPAFPAPAAPSRIPTSYDHLTHTAAVAVFCSALWSGFSPPLTYGLSYSARDPTRGPRVMSRRLGCRLGGRRSSVASRRHPVVSRRVPGPTLPGGSRSTRARIAAVRV